MLEYIIGHTLKGTVQITGNIASTRECTSSGGRVTHILLAFPFCATCNQFQPHKNNRVYILLAHSRQQPCPHKYTPLVKIFLCCIVEYCLSVVNVILFICCSSVTDHLLSAMPCLSIETRYCIILSFLLVVKCTFLLFKKD